MTDTHWIKRAGSTRTDEYDVVIRPGDTGWSHTGLLVTNLEAGESRTVETGGCEFIVLPLSGGATVEVGDTSYELQGRASVFAGPSDSVYIPRDSAFTVTSTSGGRYAFPHAKAATIKPVCKVEASAVPVEMRGAGRASRQVNNFGTPGTVDADSIITCEVLTPAGNWSSYPPHKHDVDRDGVEAALEEIYYFEMAVDSRYADAMGAGATSPTGYQVVYGTAERPIDVNTSVVSGDVVLVPHGWHGPSMAPPGYDMYYVNVMAGPAAHREWLFCDDPTHTWVRSTWAHEQVDDRLPFGA